MKLISAIALATALSGPAFAQSTQIASARDTSCVHVALPHQWDNVAAANGMDVTLTYRLNPDGTVQLASLSSGGRSYPTMYGKWWCDAGQFWFQLPGSVAAPKPTNHPGLLIGMVDQDGKMAAK